MQRIAILTSTSPLRKTSTVQGITRQRINLKAGPELAEKFDTVIIGSLTADEVFDHIVKTLSPDARPKFHLYPRSFFHNFQTKKVLATTNDPRNPGWEQILAENGIEFEVLRSKIGDDHRHVQQKFDWQEMSKFITDSRVTLVTGGEGQLIYEPPDAVR